MATEDDTGNLRAGLVLIGDGDREFVASLTERIRPIGYAVLCADTPDRALAALREPPDGEAAPVALIDLLLDGGGLELIARLQAAAPELVCVLMVSRLDTGIAIDALHQGVFDVLEKSGAQTALLPLLERCFDRVARHREREALVDSLLLAKQAAEAASRSKSGFLATISHELRTPLNAIIGFSEMMLRGMLGPIGNEQYRTYVSDIHDSGTHLLRIINDILDLSKAEAGKLDLQEEEFDVRRTIRSVRQLMAERVRKGGLSDSVELPADLPLLRADERKTKQVLLNLFANAVKFTPPGGKVAMTGRFDPVGGLQLTVSDTGIGIAPHDLGRVLEPFEQVDSSLSRAHQGTGLGLPLVRAIMELHGGGIELRSTLGSGTQVTVTFPAQRTVGATAAAKSRSVAA